MPYDFRAEEWEHQEHNRAKPIKWTTYSAKAEDETKTIPVLYFAQKNYSDVTVLKLKIPNSSFKSKGLI